MKADLERQAAKALAVAEALFRPALPSLFQVAVPLAPVDPYAPVGGIVSRIFGAVAAPEQPASPAVEPVPVSAPPSERRPLHRTSAAILPLAAATVPPASFSSPRDARIGGQSAPSEVEVVTRLFEGGQTMPERTPALAAPPHAPAAPRRAAPPPAVEAPRPVSLMARGEWKTEPGRKAPRAARATEESGPPPSVEPKPAVAPASPAVLAVPASAPTTTRGVSTTPAPAPALRVVSATTGTPPPAGLSAPVQRTDAAAEPRAPAFVRAASTPAQLAALLQAEVTSPAASPAAPPAPPAPFATPAASLLPATSFLGAAGEAAGSNAVAEELLLDRLVDRLEERQQQESIRRFGLSGGGI